MLFDPHHTLAPQSTFHTSRPRCGVSATRPQTSPNSPELDGPRPSQPASAAYRACVQRHHQYQLRLSRVSYVDHGAVLLDRKEAGVCSMMALCLPSVPLDCRGHRFTGQSKPHRGSVASEVALSRTPLSSLVILQ